jgi:iron complex outermembrane receptor protein
MKKILTLFSIFIVNFCFGQVDSVNHLEEIVLKGSFSPVLNSGYHVEIIKDSIVENENQSLGNLLQNQVNLYFKQNGYGMVSSIALRGSNASQTGVYWNGISINSSLNGQTDFNTISANSFEEVEIRKGGGSVLLGSGAVGGAINLKDRIVFYDKKGFHLNIGMGSYDTYSMQSKAVISTDNLFAKIAFGGTTSANDYPYLDTDLKNENGSFKNYNFNAVFGYKFDDNNQIHANALLYDNERNNSRTLTTQSSAKLLNTDSRFFLDWKNLGNRYSSSFKLAYLKDDFTYFFDKNSANSSEGNSKNFIAKEDFTYFLNTDVFFTTGLEFKNQTGSGSNIENVEQNDFTAYLLLHHQPFQNFSYNASIRKGASSAYQIPFIYSLDLRYKLFEKYVFKANYATNYRLPTFNDLYWEPGGNPDLNAEKSNSAEISFGMVQKDFEINLTSFYIQSKDMIQWQPLNATIWQPINIQDVTNYGLEFSAFAEKRFAKHIFQIKAQYDYTISDDKGLDKQLIYVPNHKANAIFNYQIKDWNFNYNLQYTGEVFITTNNSQTLDAYWLSNCSVSKKILKNKMKIAFSVNNIFNENYESVAYRPMPNRNFLINLNLKL